MKFRLVFFILVSIGGVHHVFGQATLRTMFYNVLNYPSAPPSNREDLLAEILEDINPDLFMICELETEAGGDEILSESFANLPGTYDRSEFVPNASGGAEIHQMIFYNTQRFDLIAQGEIVSVTRDINYFRLNVLDQGFPTPVSLYVFVAHLKAGQGDYNENRRFIMADAFTDFLETIPDDSNVIFTGDLNVYSSQEFAYLEITNTLNGTNNITMRDPIGQAGGWHTNFNYRAIHTQSTRTSSSTGAGGGLDDRFDFILVSQNMMDPNHEISYVEDTYETYGNNGNCYNDNIGDVDCSGFYGQDLRQTLEDMSDHLPVIMNLELNSDLLLVETPQEKPRKPLLKNSLVRQNVYLNLPPDQAELHVAIFDSFGKKVLATRIPTDQESLEVATLSPGVYFFTIEDARYSPEKFVIYH
ncbi:hypothetical protein GCM10009117_13320 [Gangjinia marincola]|uniref:Uncharacterized protein n=1 Tax=Gangjinia marincola TaxID=578463 RepID=A0ABP3XSI9_9FLAO